MAWFIASPGNHATRQYLHAPRVILTDLRMFTEGAVKMFEDKIAKRDYVMEITVKYLQHVTRD